eukprot:scaffold459_cov117-Isochrysis_galbana.AAC.3
MEVVVPRASLPKPLGSKQQGWGFEFISAVKHAVSVFTEIWSRGVSAASSAYSSGRGKLSRRGPLYPLPHLVGGDGSILSGIASRASPLLSSPRVFCIALKGRPSIYMT